jgi:hypothetical protein
VSKISQNDSVAKVDGGAAPKADAAVDAEPDARPPPDAPHVGIFWCVLDPAGTRHLLAERCALDVAEEYGDCLTFGLGHYEVWQRWQRARAPIPSLASVIRGHEYEEWPRGRVVFDRKADRFFLYADYRIQRAGILPELMASFCLPADRVIVRADPHYRSSLPIAGPLRLATLRRPR